MPPRLSFHRRRTALTTPIPQNDPNQIANVLANKAQSPTARHLTTAITNASCSALHALLETFYSPSPCQGALTTKTTPQSLIPALHAATAALDPVSVSVLLSSAVPPRALEKGLEPLHVAVRTKVKTPREAHALTQVIHVLIAAGALEGDFEDDMYPPNYALVHRNDHAFSAFFTHAARHLSPNLYKYSTIRYVCTHPSSRALSTLLPYIDITKPDAYKSTPLHHAVSSPHASEGTILDMVRIIVNAGCPVDARDLHGRTPFQIVKRRRMQTVVDFLITSGASQETFAQVLLRRAKHDSKKRAARIVRTGSSVMSRSGKCSICLEGLASKQCIETSCGHTHHSDCLSNWVLKTPSCPLCKHRIS